MKLVWKSAVSFPTEFLVQTVEDKSSENSIQEEDEEQQINQEESADS